MCLYDILIARRRLLLLFLYALLPLFFFFHTDVVVGAPWEGDGAVYIYQGSASGLRSHYSQRITPQDFPQSLTGFGMAVSRGIDIDGNNYPGSHKN